MNKAIVALGALGMFVVVVLAWTSLVSVESGHVGVVTTFGKVEPDVLEEGMHVVAPWRRVRSMSIRTQEQKETTQVPTKEGLAITLESSILFALNKEKARDVFQQVGPDYVDVIVVPQVRSAIRAVTVKYQAKDLYTAGRAEVENDLEATIQTELDKRGLRCEKLLLRKIEIPEVVRNAIEQKLAAEQDTQRMQFILDKERQEADRKKIDAQGTAEANRLITETLTENYVRYLWVKALEGNAAKPSTTIYVPTGPDGMPLVANVANSNKGK